MIIGSIVFELHLPGVNSLKEKRGRVKSLLKRLRNKFNISAAEVGMNDKHRMAVIGVAAVSNDKDFTQTVLNKVATMIELEPEMNIVDYYMEIL